MGARRRRHHLDRVRAIRAQTPLMTSVCTGALVFAAAGLLAGIDMTLHLLARLDSVAEAQAVRRGIQYDPAPPV